MPDVPVPLATLLLKETKDAIYNAALAVGSAIGLPVTSWQAGDPTRSLYRILAEKLAILEDSVVGFITSGFLDYATGDWLTVLAKQVFNVDVPPASYATTDVILTNTGAGVYDLEAGDLVLKCTVSGKTYTITSGGHLASGIPMPATLRVSVVADEAGSDSSAGEGEIDELVTTLLGVTCSNPLAAIGQDQQDEATTRQQCRDKLDSLSPNGPKGAAAYVARNADLTGTRSVTRVRVYGDSETGEFTVYLASPSGGVTEPDRVLVEAAIVRWATALCFTPTVLAATNVTVNVTYSLSIYSSVNKNEAEIKAAVLAALEAMIGKRPIGGDIIAPATTGHLDPSLIETTIQAVFPQCFKAGVVLPSSSVSIGNGEVAALGTVVGTVTFVKDP